jgi:hypothetical protein
MNRPLPNPVVGVPPQWAGLPMVAPTEQEVYATKFLWRAKAAQKGATHGIFFTQRVAMDQVTCMESAGIIQMSILTFQLSS